MNANRVGHPPAVGRGDRQRPAGARNWPPAVRLREAPTVRLGCGSRRSEAAALAMGYGERWDGR
jgi:hypothetical protein